MGDFFMSYETKSFKNTSYDTKSEQPPSSAVTAALEAFGGNGEKIFTFEGEEAGPSIFIIGGIHGNEETGIIVVHEILKSLQSGSVKLKAGRVILGLGNPRAIQHNRRALEGGHDMNRLFKLGIESEESGEWEIQRAQKLASFIREADITIDLHSTNKPSEPFVISRTSEKHRALYRRFEHSAVLEDLNLTFWGEVATTEEYADAHGRIGIGIETGQASDLTKVPGVLQSIASVCVDAGMVDGVSEGRQYDAPVYTILGKVIFQEGFRFTNETSVRNFMEINAGEIFAYIGDTPVIAKYDCVIVFPKISSLREIGKPVCWLAKLKKD